MTTEQFLDLEQRVTSLEQHQGELKQSISAFKIDRQLFLPIQQGKKPGIGTKLAFDANGLIIGTEPLNHADIPQLPIQKISGLEDMLASKVSTSEFQKLQEQVSRFETTGEVVATGTKVNVDSRGRVLSTSSISAEDLPMIPMEKIDGLAEAMMNFSPQNTSVGDAEEFHVSAGTATKITYDAYGRVIRGSPIGEEDLPFSLLTRLETVESKIPFYDRQCNEVESLYQMLSKKLEANPPVASGTYTKVRVDANGLVVKGDHLALSDLPQIHIADIQGLAGELSHKADRAEVQELNSSIEMMLNSLDRIPDVQPLYDSLAHKASTSELNALQRTVEELQSTLSKFMESIPGDRILEQLTQINQELLSVSGRLSVLERYTRT